MVTLKIEIELSAENETAVKNAIYTLTEIDYTCTCEGQEIRIDDIFDYQLKKPNDGNNL